MSDEKTEQPTAKKLRDARQKGQVAMSKELTSMLTILATFSIIWLLGGHGVSMISEFLMLPIEYIDKPFEEALRLMLGTTLMTIIWLTLPVLVLVVVAAVAGNVVQVGVLFSTESIKPDLTKISPVKGLEKIFSKDNLFELLKNILKVFVLGLVMWMVLRDAMASLLYIPLYGSQAILPVLNDILKHVVILSTGIFVVAAVADYFFQKYRHTEKLKMSKDEVKREHKDSEGDPLIKGLRRQMHREMSQNNMLSQVRKATVVITNPTHRAVAIFYDKEVGGLPVVLGKGADLLAKQIITIAEAEGIPIMQNIPLARALYDDAEVDRYIPSELIQPVAEVLRWVRDLKKKEESLTED